MRITVMSNGMVAAFDDKGQVPELQLSLIDLYAKHAERQGFDPTTFKLDYLGRRVKIF